MVDDIDELEPSYAALDDYAQLRTNELSKLLEPYIAATNRYGDLICRITLMLGKMPPASKEDAMLRDLMADVFDFLYEARIIIIKGKLEVAYPLARRAYESLSLVVACHLEPKLARRWMAGKRIGNAEVRRVLAKHPFGEREEYTREIYGFFSQVTHPNRETVAYRFLGEGNEFVLGAIGRPSLALLADYALKTLNLWHWLAAFVSFIYVTKLDREMLDAHHEARKYAQEVAKLLAEQFNRLLAEEQAEMSANSRADLRK